MKAEPRPPTLQRAPAGRRSAAAALCLFGALGCEEARKFIDDGAPPGLEALDCPEHRATGGLSPAARFATSIGKPERLLLGLGNDSQGRKGQASAYTLGAPLDLHYLYLVGLPGRGGWDEWNPDGRYVDINARAARSQCMVPMFTLYAMAVDGEANMAALTDAAYMEAWWNGLNLVLKRLGRSEEPSILHVEPDFWGFAQQLNPGLRPDQIPAKVSDLTEGCDGLPDTLQGLGQCVVARSRALSPSTKIGFHASLWAGEPEQVAAFLNGLGAADTDLLFVETLDRDAGCFEARAPDCTREDGPWYWDIDERRSPHLGEHLDRVSALHRETGLPLMWWQTPLGVPQERSGGSPGAYRDNRVPILLSNTMRLVESGGVGVVFGSGFAKQTTVETDGGQLRAAALAYSEEPTPLP